IFVIFFDREISFSIAISFNFSISFLFILFIFNAKHKSPHSRSTLSKPLSQNRLKPIFHLICPKIPSEYSALFPRISSPFSDIKFLLATFFNCHSFLLNRIWRFPCAFVHSLLCVQLLQSEHS